MKVIEFKKGKQKFSIGAGDLSDRVNARNEIDTIVDVLSLSKSSIFSRINVLENVKSEVILPSIRTDAVLQKITGCKFFVNGQTKISEEILKVTPVGTAEEYCNEDLVGKWAEVLLKQGLNGQNDVPEPAEALHTIHAYNWRRRAERLWWLGDEDSTDNELAIADGFYKKVLNGGVTIPKQTITSSNAWGVFWDLINKINPAFLQNGIRYEIRTSRQNVTHLLNYIWNNKDYNALVQGVSLNDEHLEFIMPVTGFRIVEDFSLENKHLIAVPLNLTYVGTDAYGDFNFVNMKHDNYNDLSKIEVKARIGFGISVPSAAVCMELDSVTPPPPAPTISNATHDSDNDVVIITVSDTDGVNDVKLNGDSISFNPTSSTEITVSDVEFEVGNNQLVVCNDGGCSSSYTFIFSA